MTNLHAEERDATITHESFAQAYRGGFGLTVRFLRSKGASPDQAEEVAQNAWTRGWEARHQLHEPHLVVPWVNTIAYHKLCSFNRRSGRYVALTEWAGADHESSSARPDARTMLSMCPPKDRALLVQRYFEGLDIREIAERQGLSEVAVRVRIHRCQNGLRRASNRPLGLAMRAITAIHQ